MAKEHDDMLYPVLKIFQTQINLAQELECLRIKLANTEDFNLVECYKCFTTKQKSFLDAAEFEQG